jgi:hypothetical protein
LFSKFHRCKAPLLYLSWDIINHKHCNILWVVVRQQVYKVYILMWLTVSNIYYTTSLNDSNYFSTWSPRRLRDLTYYGMNSYIPFPQNLVSCSFNNCFTAVPSPSSILTFQKLPQSWKQLRHIWEATGLKTNTYMGTAEKWWLKAQDTDFFKQGIEKLIPW